MKLARLILSLLLSLLVQQGLWAQQRVTLHFTNTVGAAPLELNSGRYFNAAGEAFSVGLLQYFISNIQFTTVNGSSYIVPQDSSYFLVQQHDSASQHCAVTLPPASYNGVRFTIGIDSLRCTSRISERKGILDPSLTDMYWGWNSGYIFLKLEGSSAAAPEDGAGLHKFRYHIGGFGGYNAATINNIKTVQLSFPNDELLQLKSGSATLEITADILKLFNGAAPLSIAEHPAVMFDAVSTTVANNYGQMFSLKAINDN